MIQEPSLLGSGFDHRQDAGLDRLGRGGPCGQDGFGVASVKPPTRPDRESRVRHRGVWQIRSGGRCGQMKSGTAEISST